MVKTMTIDRFGIGIVISLCYDGMPFFKLPLLSASVLVMGTSVTRKRSMHHGWEEGKKRESLMIGGNLTLLSCRGSKL